MIEALYKFITDCGYAVLTPYWGTRLRKHPVEWNQRLAKDPAKYLPSGLAECIWAHASSVGEVRVLHRLMGALKTKRPELRYCISTYTKMGQALAKELFPEATAVFYFPLDSRRPLTRLLDHFQPQAVIFVETEIWPYFLRFCLRRTIPVILANGRISEKSHRWYRMIRSSLAPLFGAYRRFIMQSEVDAARMTAIGADPARVVVAGNMKYDTNGSGSQPSKRKSVRQSLKLQPDEVLMIAASTRPGEEEIICRAMSDIESFPKRLKLLLAPRHLDRLEEVAGHINQCGVAFVTHSNLLAGAEPAPIILMDKMGLLAELFYGADISFVGGTLVDIGGHNLMEPAQAGVPVLFGPSVHNVQEAADRLLAAHQGMMVHDAAELAEAVNKFCRGEITFRKIQANGESATEKTAAVIIEELRL
jgi:3-deoxy-D-manno-octulosonic-acid transferase